MCSPLLIYARAKDIIYFEYNLKHKKGDKFEFERIPISNHSQLPLKRVHDSLPLQKIREERDIGTFISFIARVEGFRQVPKGPKVFTLLDESGIIEAAAFKLDFLDEIRV